MIPARPTINEKLRCVPDKPWQSEIIGFVDKILVNSCIIRITITDKADVVISKKAMVEKIS